MINKTCPHCNGTGKKIDNKCKKCGSETETVQTNKHPKRLSNGSYNWGG